jgi:hypothetical protein
MAETVRYCSILAKTHQRFRFCVVFKGNSVFDGSVVGFQWEVEKISKVCGL